MPADNSTYDIQELVTESGVPRRTVYFYVQQGILPPPQGAGLAAHYTEEHLLRLQLIPLLRRQGLRLDEIRKKFEQMNLEEMRGMIAAAQVKAPEPPLFREEWRPPSPDVIPTPGIIQAGWGEQRYIHYSLPGGINLAAPENLNPVDRQRLNLLLQAARQIFTGAVPTYVYFQTGSPGEENNPPGNGENRSA